MIVSSARKVTRTVGKVLDAEDRKLFSQLLVLSTTVAFLIVGGAGILGFAVRLFFWAAG